MVSSLNKVLFELKRKFPKGLIPRTLGDNVKSGKYENWVEIKSSALFPEQSFCNRGQNLCKSRYQRFWLLFSFSWFLWFISNVLSRIAVGLQNICSSSMVISSTISDWENLQSHYWKRKQLYSHLGLFFLLNFAFCLDGKDPSVSHHGKN